MIKFIAAVFALCLFFHSSLLAQSTDRLKQVEQFSNESKHEESFNLASAVLKDEPNNAEAHAWLGLYYVNTQKYQLALPSFLKSYSIFSAPNYKASEHPTFDQARTLYWISTCYHILKDFKKELYYTRLQAKLSTDQAVNYNNLASAYRANQMYDSCIYACKELIKIKPNHWPSYYQLGHCYYSKDKVEIGAYYYEKAIEIGSDPANEAVAAKLNAYPFARMGELRLAQGNPKAANESFTKAIEKFNEQGLSAGDGEVYALTMTNRAITKETLLDFEGALADLKLASQVDPTNESIVEVSVRVNKKLQAQKSAAESKTKVGCFEGDCDSGTGSYRYASGDVYKGQFSDGMSQGVGVMKWTSGDTYSGTFVAGALADGTFTKADGSAVKFAGGKQVVAQEFKNVNYEDQQSVKKARKGGFWKALGDIVAGGAVIALAVMNEQELEKKRIEERQSKAAASNSASSAQKTTTTKRVRKCAYRIEWRLVNDVLKMSSVFRVSRDADAAQLGGVAVNPSIFQAMDKAAVTSRRDDIKLQYASDGYGFDPIQVNDKCAEN